jgi:hypothetical protein
MVNLLSIYFSSLHQADSCDSVSHRNAGEGGQGLSQKDAMCILCFSLNDEFATPLLAAVFQLPKWWSLTYEALDY